MGSLYSFGTDELGKALNEHVRLTRPFDRVWMIQPYSEIYSRTDKGAKPRGSRVQVWLILNAIRRMAAAGDIQLATWDGITNLSKSLKNEVAQSGVNRDENTKNMAAQWSPDAKSMLNMPGMNWRDYGMVQEFMRMDFRNPILAAPEPFHFIGLGHEVLNENEGEYGPDVGGPKSWNWPGGMFDGVFWIGKMQGKRCLIFDDTPRGAYEIKASLKTSPDVQFAEEGKTYVEIPDTYDGCVELLQRIRDIQGSPVNRWCFYGPFNGGKTALSSAMWGTTGIDAGLVVMSDQQLGLSTFWPQVRAAGTALPKEAK